MAKLTELEEAKKTISIFQRRQLREINTKVRIQVSIGSLLVCNKEINEYLYNQYSHKTRKDWHNLLMSNHAEDAENYEFIEEIFKLAKERKITIKVQFSAFNRLGHKVSGECTFIACDTGKKNEYCVKRFFKAWAEAWQKAISAKGMLLEEEHERLEENEKEHERLEEEKREKRLEEEKREISQR